MHVLLFMSVFAKAALRVQLPASVRGNAACCASPSSGVEVTANQSQRELFVVISYNYIFLTDLIIVL